MTTVANCNASPTMANSNSLIATPLSAMTDRCTIHPAVTDRATIYPAVTNCRLTRQ
jgi:hypothetical protein